MAILLKIDDAPVERTSARPDSLPPRSQWEALAIDHRTPMQHYIWLESCYATLYPGDKWWKIYYNFSSRVLNWPYYHGLTAPHDPGHDLRNHWIDPDDPSFAGRAGS
jgi:hypothetical protein